MSPSRQRQAAISLSYGFIDVELRYNKPAVCQGYFLLRFDTFAHQGFSLLTTSVWDWRISVIGSVLCLVGY